MQDESRILDLVVRWEELRDAGQSVDLEDLCRGCPELLSVLRQRVRALDAMNVVLSDSETVSDHSARERIAESLTGFPELPGYEILYEVGRGGMGVVYGARQAGLNRLVAVKVLLGGRHATSTARARFKSEVEAVARLQHPNLIQVFEVGEHAGQTFFSMEFVDGGNLETHIAGEPQSVREAAELVENLAKAMHAAHERGVIHRDLKPANVLLSGGRPIEDRSGVRPFGIPKISDFGLAKRIDVQSGPTLSEQILGTPSYMAPEQAQGQSKQVSPATDIYALGAILYRLLTGRPPFLDENVVALLRQVIDDEPVTPRQLRLTIPIDLETICLKCLNKHPAQRYLSAAALADDLHCFLAGEPILARPINVCGRIVKWARRRPAAASLVAVIGLAVVLFLTATSWFANRLSTELQNTRAAHQRALAAHENLELALTRQVADALDADFRQLEKIPQLIAALLSQRVRYDEDELEGWIQALVKNEKRIFGIGIAFEPRQFVGARVYEDYCHYIYENADGLSAKQLLPPLYPAPFYRERDWYTLPKTTGHPWWSEPYLGQRADNTPMLTYSVPLFRAEEFIGVVFADLSIEYFKELHNRLQKQYLGPESYSFVTSANGTVIYHPDSRYEFPMAAPTPDAMRTTPEGFLSLLTAMRLQNAGKVYDQDFDGGQPAMLYFARIPVTGAYFVLVHRGLADDEQSERLQNR